MGSKEIISMDSNEIIPMDPQEIISVESKEIISMDSNGRERGRCMGTPRARSGEPCCLWRPRM